MVCIYENDTEVYMLTGAVIYTGPIKEVFALFKNTTKKMPEYKGNGMVKALAYEVLDKRGEGRAQITAMIELEEPI